MIRSLFNLLIIVGCLSATGCEKYGTVSPAAYDLAKALYSTTNRHKSENLTQIQSKITLAHADGSLTVAEKAWLEQIVEDARQGNWEEANSECRRMMEEQIVEPQ